MTNESDPTVVNEATANSTDKQSPTDSAAPEQAPTSTPETPAETPAETTAAPVAQTSETVSATDPAPAPPADASTGPASKPKVQIGSQRDVAEKTLKPAAVAKASQNPVQLGDQPVAPPEPEVPVEIGSLEGLSDDLEAEIAAAIGGVSMDAVVSETEAGDSLEPGSRVKGSVTKTHGENVFMSLKGRFEGIVPLTHFKTPPNDGDLIEVSVKGLSEEDGLYELSVPGAAVSIGDWDELEKGQVVEAMVTGSNTGGLEASVSNIRGFIPASQISRFRVENFGDFVNKKLQCVVQEVNAAKKRLVLSHRAVLEREREEQRKELMEKNRSRSVVRWHRHKTDGLWRVCRHWRRRRLGPCQQTELGSSHAPQRHLVRRRSDQSQSRKDCQRYRQTFTFPPRYDGTPMGRDRVQVHGRLAG